MKRFIVLLCVFAFIFVVGCGTNVSMRGKVTFDDGTPLTAGMVIVENKSTMARGEIQSDGSYVIGSLSKRDGLAPGEYQVYITGAAKEIGIKPNGDAIRELLIDRKFTLPDNSELSINIQKATTYNITVTRPTEQTIL